MNIFFTILLLVIILFCFILFLIAPGHSSKSMRESFLNHNIAHRGLHTKNKKIPENSFSAFSASIKKGYGIEFDIRLTKDKQVVVFHDATLTRVCGVNGRVDAFTYKELQNFCLYETKEHIPLFTEVLALADGRIPLVIELKNDSDNETLCKLTFDILKNYQGSFCIESFHPLIVAWFRKNAPTILRGQLSAQTTELRKTTSVLQAFGLSRLLSNCISRPHFIAYRKGRQPFFVKLCCALNAMCFVWTIHPEDIPRKHELKHDCVIFEYYTPEPIYRSSNLC